MSKRLPIPPQLSSLLKSAQQVGADMQVAGVIMLAEWPYDFQEVAKALEPLKLIVASHVEEVQAAVAEDNLPIIQLSDEPQTRQVQLAQALVEAVADELLQTGSRVVALFSSFDRDAIDTQAIVSLYEHLSKLTSRDLQRLETQVPLETLRRVVDLAVEIGREGREGKKVGTLFVVGDHRKTLQMSHEQVHDPFKGYQKKDRMIRSAKVRESMKELAQIDGAFLISSDGCVMAAGRILNAPGENLTLSKGLGSRHWAAASISRATKAVAIAVSESTGTVRIFRDGAVVLRIEPMDRAMKWMESDAETTEAE
ncbi:MAG: DNA integrity scanning protein DisA nucleotide-binding domain protein [Planctomycetaceae bacterium]